MQNRIEPEDAPNITPAAHRRIYRKSRESGHLQRAAVVAAQYLDRTDCGTATEAAAEFAKGTKISRSSFWRQVRVGRLLLERLDHPKCVPMHCLKNGPMSVGLITKIIDYAKAGGFNALHLLFHLEEVEGITVDTFDRAVSGFRPLTSGACMVMPEGEAPSNWVMWGRSFEVLAAQGPASAVTGQQIQMEDPKHSDLMVEAGGKRMTIGQFAHQMVTLPLPTLALPTLVRFEDPRSVEDTVPRTKNSEYSICLQILCPEGVRGVLSIQETPDSKACWVSRLRAREGHALTEIQNYFEPLISSLSSFEGAAA